MAQCPYKNGDVISLEQQYVIINPFDETEKFWLIEALQVATKNRVLVKVFINEGFSNIVLLEEAWRQEVDDLKSGKDSTQNIVYIESGVLMVSGEKQFIIVFDDDRLIQESTSGPVKTDDAAVELPSSVPADILPKDISEALEDVINAYPAKQEIAIDDDTAKEAIEEKMTEAEPDIDMELAEEPELIEEPAATEEPMKPEAIEEKPMIPGAPKKASIESPPPPPTTGAPKSTLPRREKKADKKRKAVAIPVEEAEDEKLAFGVAEEEKDYLKHISMEYFDRMNPQNYYPIKINISDIIGKTIIPTVNPLTGERKVQKQEEMEATLTNPIVTIRPTIPGCSVVPSQIDTNFTLAEDEVIFFITPGVKGEIIGHIEFLNEDVQIYKTEFEAKVVDPRIARIVAFYGILTSFVPKIVSLLGIGLGLDTTLSDLWSVAENTFGNMNIASLIAIAGIIPVILLSIGVRQRLKPKSCKTHFKIRDFRLKGIKPSKTL